MLNLELPYLPVIHDCAYQVLKLNSILLQTAKVRLLNLLPGLILGTALFFILFALFPNLLDWFQVAYTTNLRSTSSYIGEEFLSFNYYIRTQYLDTIQSSLERKGFNLHFTSEDETMYTRKKRRFNTQVVTIRQMDGYFLLRTEPFMRKEFDTVVGDYMLVKFKRPRISF